jgi:DNA-binding response OmpR family regulator
MARVLLVDDDADALELRKLILESHGHEVRCAQTAGSAREQFRPEQVVVLDLRIPDAEDGLALIREFKAARIIVLTGAPADLNDREERKLVAAVLTKPARSEQLLAAITARSAGR